MSPKPKRTAASDQAKIGAAIRAHRRALGMTLAELSLLSDVSANYLSQLETGKRDPGLLLLRSVASALGLEVADLLHPDSEVSSESHEALYWFEQLGAKERKFMLVVLQGFAERKRAMDHKR